MDVSDLRWLAEISKIAGLDEGKEPTMVFSPLETGGVMASFTGLHTYARRIHSSMVFPSLKQPVAVPWKLMQGALSLMPERGELKARFVRNDLILECGGRKATVRISLTGDVSMDDSYDGLEKVFSFPVDVALQTARAMRPVTGSNLAKPELAGIHLLMEDEQDVLAFSASDGVGRAMAAIIPITERGSQKFDTIIHADDLVASLEILHTEASIGFSLQTVVLWDAATLVALSALQGAFPSFGELPKEGAAFTLSLKADDVKAATRAARIVESKFVLIDVVDGQGFLRTVETELGNVDVEIGALETGNVRIAFSVDSFSTISDLAENVSILLWSANRPALAYARQMYYWLMPSITPLTAATRSAIEEYEEELEEVGA